MGGHTMTENESDTAEELQAAFDAPAYGEKGKEKEEDQKNPNDAQVEDIDRQLDAAHKKGIICTRDKMTLWGRIHSLSEEDKKRAPELIKEHLKKKQSYLEDFDEELQKAVKNGDLTENEAKKKMKEYQEKNGETREKMAEREFPKQLEALRKEKKKFEELLQESSHYCKEGKLSSEAKKMCEDYEELDEAGKKKEKKNLIRRIDRRNNAAKLCTGYYQEAKNLFEEGEYSKALRLMKRNMRICEHYPDSIMLQDYLEWAETDISNLQWEKEQSDHVQDAREDRDDSIKSGDHEMALETSKTLVNLTKEWLETTFSGSDEEEKPRETKWITPFMKKSSEEAEKTHQALVKIYEHLVQEEQEEEGQLEEEQDLLDQEMSKDVAIQAHMKAASDTQEDIDTPETLPVFSRVMKEEGEEVKVIYHDEVEDYTEEELEDENTIVTIDEDKDFELQKDEAKEIMSADTPIRMTKDGEELETRKEVEEELNERMLEGETRLLNRLIKEGKISPDVADQERRRIRKMRSTDQLGKTLLEEDRRSGRGIVQSERRDWNAENMEEILEGVREKDQNLQHPLNQVASFQRKRKQKRVERLAEVA